jgi:hypothetical protein
MRYSCQLSQCVSAIDINGDTFESCRIISLRCFVFCYNPEQAPRYEGVWVSGGIAPTFLTLALDGGEWSASRPGHFTAGERAPDTHWIGGWVGPRAGLNAVKKRNFFTSAGNRTPAV